MNNFKNKKTKITQHVVQPIAALDSEFRKLVQGNIVTDNFRIPYLIIYAVIISILMWFTWNKTKLGKNMFAICKIITCMLISRKNEI